MQRDFSVLFDRNAAQVLILKYNLYSFLQHRSSATATATDRGIPRILSTQCSILRHHIDDVVRET